MLHRSTFRLRRSLIVVAAVAGGAALGGCQVKDSTGDLARGKKLFVSKCGSCHVLRHAGTKGTVGPNLDDAFDRDRADGFPSDTIRGVVHKQILYPNNMGKMPGKLVTGGDAYDVASYVALVVARPGQDTGLLASIGQAGKKKNIAEAAGKLTIPADPTGQLAYTVGTATAKAGPVTIDSPNKSGTPHDIAVTGPGISQTGGKVVSNGGVSTVHVTLQKGTYTFFCTVPGHRQAGMQGTIKVG